MGIVPSHFVWQRERSQYHSGAQRQYGDRDHACFPRGPFASPVSCGLCNHGPSLGQALTSPSPPRSSPNTTYPQPFISLLTLETTPQRDRATHGKVMKTEGHVQHSSSCCEEEDPSKYHEFKCDSWVRFHISYVKT